MFGWKMRNAMVGITLYVSDSSEGAIEELMPKSKDGRIIRPLDLRKGI